MGDLQLRRRGGTLRNGGQRTGEARRVTARHLISGLGDDAVAETGDGEDELIELGAGLGELIRGGARLRQLGGHSGPIALPLAGQHQAVDHVVGGDALQRQRGLLELAGHQRRQLAQRRDEGVQADVMQVAFDAVAKQRAEWLTLPHAVQQLPGLPDPARAEPHGEGAGGRRRAGRAELGVA